MKVHIIGCSGTGKSFFAGQLSRCYHLPHYDLDDLFWDNSANQYGARNSAERRAEQLKEILKQDDWVIEGVYYAWLQDSFKAADIIFILDLPKRIFQFRLIRRFVRRKLGIEKGKKETLNSFIALLKWADQYERQNLPKIYSILEKHKQKVIVIHKSKELLRYIK